MDSSSVMPFETAMACRSLNSAGLLILGCWRISAAASWGVTVAMLWWLTTVSPLLLGRAPSPRLRPRPRSRPECRRRRRATCTSGSNDFFVSRVVHSRSSSGSLLRGGVARKCPQTHGVGLSGILRDVRGSEHPVTGPRYGDFPGDHNARPRQSSNAGKRQEPRNTRTFQAVGPGTKSVGELDNVRYVRREIGVAKFPQPTGLTFVKRM